MSNAYALQSFLEICALVFFIISFINEDKLVNFEKRLFKRCKRFFRKNKKLNLTVYSRKTEVDHYSA